MTTLGLIYAAAYAVSLAWGRRGVVVVLASSISLNSSAAIVIGDIAITPFYAGMLVYLPIAIVAHRRRVRATPRSAAILVLLFVYTAAATTFGPAYFEGLGVFASGVGLDEQVGALTPLQPSLSNLAQLAYLGMNLLLVFLNERDGLISTTHVSIGLGVGLVIAVIALISSRTGLPWPYELFDNSPRGFYARSTERLRAQFAEPSQLGGFALTSTAFFLARAGLAKTPRDSLLAGVAAASGGALVLASASGTAVIGAIVALAAILVLTVIRFAHMPSPRTVSAASILTVLGIVIAAAILTSPAITFVLETVEDKVGGESWQNRNTANAHALDVLWSTHLVGAGLGSNRASSLLFLLLSTIGLLGTVCFLLLIVRSIRASMDDSRFPAAVALTAFLCAAVVSLADFASPYMWLLIVVCNSRPALLPLVTPAPGRRSAIRSRPA